MIVLYMMHTGLMLCMGSFLTRSTRPGSQQMEGEARVRERGLRRSEGGEKRGERWAWRVGRGHERERKWEIRVNPSNF